MPYDVKDPGGNIADSCFQTLLSMNGKLIVPAFVRERSHLYLACFFCLWLFPAQPVHRRENYIHTNVGKIVDEKRAAYVLQASQ